MRRLPILDGSEKNYSEPNVKYGNNSFYTDIFFGSEKMVLNSSLTTNYTFCKEMLIIEYHFLVNFSGLKYTIFT